VTTVLKDKAMKDAKDELEGLRKRVESFSMVEIVFGIEELYCDFDLEQAPVVYASGDFADGFYSLSPSLWEVNVSSKQPACQLADLPRCQICVGGLPLQLLGDHGMPYVEGYFSYDDDGRNRIVLEFDGSHLQIVLSVEGWPKQEWVPLVSRDWDEACVLTCLIDAGKKYPNATVCFRQIWFATNYYRGSFQKLLTLQQRKDAYTAWSNQERLKSDFRRYAERIIASQDECKDNETCEWALGYMEGLEIYKFPRASEAETEKVVSIIRQVLRWAEDDNTSFEEMAMHLYIYKKKVREMLEEGSEQTETQGHIRGKKRQKKN